MTVTLQSLLALAPNRENSVVVNRHLAAFAGSLEAGMLLGQLLYWTPRATLDGAWIAKKDVDWAKELCLTKYAVRVAINRLRSMGVVEIEVRKFGGAPTGHYRLIPEKLAAAWEQYLSPRLFESDKSDSTNGNAEIDKSREMPQSTNENVESSKSHNKEAKTTAETTAKTTSHPQPPSPAAKPEGQKRRKGLDDYPDTPGFLRFWNTWPAHKRKVGRKQCRKKWHVGHLEPMADQVIAAVEASKRSHDWTKDGGQYIPMPETWLNQGRWEAGAALAKPQGNSDDQLLVPGKDWKSRRLTDEERAALRTLKAPELKIKPVIPEGFVPPPAAQEGGGQ